MRIIILGLVLLLTACVSSQSIAPEDGISFPVKDRSYKQVFNAAILTVASVGEITSQDRPSGQIRGLRGASAFSWGDAVAVFISPSAESAREFTVTVVSEHVDQVQLTGQDFKSTMIATMKAHLDL